MSFRFVLCKLLYPDQYRKTILVEYIPKSHRHDKVLFEFFDALFPGQVIRAEVLLNTEKLRGLIKKRLYHIKKYEDAYALKVHRQAKYLREVEACEHGGILRRGCRKILKPRKPQDTKIVGTSRRTATILLCYGFSFDSHHSRLFLLRVYV